LITIHLISLTKLLMFSSQKVKYLRWLIHYFNSVILHCIKTNNTTLNPMSGCHYNLPIYNYKYSFARWSLKSKSNIRLWEVFTGPVLTWRWKGLCDRLKAASEVWKLLLTYSQKKKRKFSQHSRKELNYSKKNKLGNRFFSLENSEKSVQSK
jgi:hypothetical protein